MVIPYKFFYLSGSLYFLLVWFIIFWKLPRYRFQMFIMGSAFWIGIIAEYFWWTKDWWHPITVTGTRIGPEDFIMCFTHIGIPVFIYKAVFKKETEKNIYPKAKLFWRMMKNFSIWFVISFIPTVILIMYFNVHSFLATIIGMILAGIYVIVRRNDLLRPMLWSAVLMTTVSFPLYWMAVFFPGIIEITWNFSKISGLKFLGAPVEDIIWYALLGFFLGGAYEFLFEFKFMEAKSEKILR